MAVCLGLAASALAKKFPAARDMLTMMNALASKITTVPVMEGAKANGKDIIGIIVNLGDYNVGADKGGAVSMFDDFDIDYNAQKYLIETRCSGALITPKSAIVLVKKAAGETTSDPAEQPAG